MTKNKADRESTEAMLYKLLPIDAMQILYGLWNAQNHDPSFVELVSEVIDSYFE